MNAPRMIAIAEIARPHGVAGELRVKLYNADSPLLSRGTSVTLELADGERRVVRVAAVRRANDALLVRLDGVVGRDASEALRGARVLVDRNTFPEPEDGEFYAVDIEGARVEVGANVVGTVKRLVSYPTCQAFEITMTDGKTLEVPLTDAFVDEVDAEAHLVKLSTLEGLE